MDFIISTILFGILFLMYYVYITLTKQRGYLETLPIPLEKPGWLFGSHPMAYHKYLMHEYQVDLFKKHKSLSVALYAGSMPCIVTIDPAIIKEVVVKQFENFTDTFDFYMDDKYKSLDITGGEAWRELRKGITETRHITRPLIPIYLISGMIFYYKINILYKFIKKTQVEVNEIASIETVMRYTFVRYLLCYES